MRQESDVLSQPFFGGMGWALCGSDCDELSCVPVTDKGHGVFEVNADGVYYRDLNRCLRDLAKEGAQRIIVMNVCGQRYIGTNIRADVQLEIYGTPGNDLGAFMDGPRINVYGNAQDGVGNTMNQGEIVIHGNAGDIVAMSMRGGRIFIRGNVGYRCGIHMKEYLDKKPIVVIGGTAQDFLGEYMAGGTIVLLGLDLEPGQKHKCNMIGTGMHGGTIFIRGNFSDHQLGKEVGVAELASEDEKLLGFAIEEFERKFSLKSGAEPSEFIKLFPKHLRPYGSIYAY